MMAVRPEWWVWPLTEFGNGKIAVYVFVMLSASVSTSHQY